jgi:predicted transcriptional regulator YdeE
MEPKIVNQNQFKIIGLKKRFKSEKKHYDNIWKEYMIYHDKIKTNSIDNAFYCIYFTPDGNDIQDHIVGIAVDNNFHNPIDVLVEHIQPSSLYATFECTVNNIGDTYGLIFSKWINNGQYAVNDKNIPCYDYYPPNTKSAEDKVFLYIPIIKNS